MTKCLIRGVGSCSGWIALAVVLVVAGTPGPGKGQSAANPKPAASPRVVTNVTARSASSRPAPVALPVPSASEMAVLQKRHQELFDEVRALNRDLGFARRNLNNDRDVAAARQAVLDAQKAYEVLVDQKLNRNPETAKMLIKLQLAILEQQRIAETLAKAPSTGVATNPASVATAPFPPGQAAPVKIPAGIPSR